jgi:hypothetical protein
MSTLQAGYAQQKITPALDKIVFLAGFDQNRPAQSIHDDLWVRCLALRDGKQVFVLIAVDLIGLVRDHCQHIEQEIRRQTNTECRVVLSSSHTHFGPDTLGLWGPDSTRSGIDVDYMRWLREAIIETGIKAVRSVFETVRVRTTETVVTGVAKNARDPKILDEELACVQLLRADNTILATLMSYPCHPEVLEPESTAISADYVHSLRETVEAKTSGAAMFVPGALGGMMTPDMPDRTHQSAKKMGEIIAHAGLAVLDDAPIDDAPMLSYERRQVAIPMQNPLFEQVMTVGLLPNRLTTEGTVITEAGLIKIGGFWMATVPGEMLPKLGLRWKDKLRKSGATVAAIAGLANDELGYILPKEAFIYPENPLDPGEHYEESMSIGPDIAPRLFDALKAIVGE